MCHDPNELPDGTVVACRKCELCRYNRVKDWAGRNIAQAKVSTASFACTLTYGPELDHNRMPIPGRKDHIRVAVLTYSDVQNFLKYLRWLGYPCDYFITGELGSLNSRTHWHVILHFRGRVPTHELGLNFSDRHVNQFGQLFDHEVCKAWPHGFMFWKEATFQDVMYNCKYILKDDDEASQRKPGMSKNPPIGAEYFLRLADLHVEQYVAPQTLKYRHKGVDKKDGGPLEFMLKGRTAEMYLERFIARWAEVHGDKPRPRSDLVDLFEQYGKIVTNEKRMLIREEFPKGESLQAIPTGNQIRAAAEAIMDLDQYRRDMADIEADAIREDWQREWIREGENVQERQRRKEWVEFERWDDQQELAEFCEYKAQHGWELVTGKGWVCSRPGPDPAGGEGYLQWRSDRGNEVAEQPRHREQLEPLGPVGKFNRANGKGPSYGGAD